MFTTLIYVMPYVMRFNVHIGRVGLYLSNYCNSQQLLLLVHKCIYHKHLLPKMFLDYFHDNQSVYTYDTRNKTDLCLV